MRLGEFVGLCRAFSRWWNSWKDIPGFVMPDDLTADEWAAWFVKWINRGQPRPGEPLK